jgi:HEPN domain-containing protein
MILKDDLITIAHERLCDAEALLNADRADTAAYFCGYAIEIALKHKICVTLNWEGFPSINAEFNNYRSLKTHDLNILLSFTGIEIELKKSNMQEWALIGKWNPELRYNPRGMVSVEDARLMIEYVRKLIALL